MFLSELHEFPSAPCLAGKKLNDSSRLDVVEISRIPDMLQSLFPSWSGLGLINTPLVGVTTEIRAGHFRNTNQMRYRMMQLALLGLSVVR